MLTILFRVRPSKTEEYNNANILSQIILLTTYMLAQYTKSTEGQLDAKARADAQTNQTIILGCLQGGFALYLIYISTVKLQAYWKIQKADILAERKVEAASRGTAAAAEASEETSEEDRIAAEKAKEQEEQDVAEAKELLIAAETKVKIQCIGHLASLKALKLSQEGLDDLVDCVRSMRFEATETLIAVDKSMTASGKRFLYWTVDGNAEVLPAKDSDDPIRVMGPGAVFGERSVIGDTVPAVWVRAGTAMQVFILEQSDFMRVITRHSANDPGLMDRYQLVRTDLSTKGASWDQWVEAEELEAVTDVWHKAQEHVEQVSPLRNLQLLVMHRSCSEERLRVIDHRRRPTCSKPKASSRLGSKTAMPPCERRTISSTWTGTAVWAKMRSKPSWSR